MKNINTNSAFHSFGLWPNACFDELKPLKQVYDEKEKSHLWTELKQSTVY